MTYFHTDDPTTVEFLARVMLIAHEKGQRVRIDVDDAGRLRVKRGEGVWSAPFYGTHDPYRDLSESADRLSTCDCPEHGA